MGIDVRAYAQKGQDVVRASCVGCGICSAVCPRGVLRLEGASEDMHRRTEKTRTVHIQWDEVKML
jgi:ferredoxin